MAIHLPKHAVRLLTLKSSQKISSSRGIPEALIGVKAVVSALCELPASFQFTASRQASRDCFMMPSEDILMMNEKTIAMTEQREDTPRAVKPTIPR